MIPIVTNEGKRARLRALRSDDLAAFMAWRNDPEIRDCRLGYRLPVTEVTERDWLQAVLCDQSRTRIFYGIEDKEDRLLVGWVSLENIDWVSRVSRFGIVIGDRAKRGRGLAAEAMHLMFGYAFLVLDMRRVCLEVAAFNEPALRLFAAFGFTVEGRLKQHVYLNDGYHDVILMSLFKTDYLAAQAKGTSQP